ncbi:hypothetical protein GCM10010492_66890 [Saccharothrix mutabilis subsp. mutabilis]|uniref:CRISPR-associated protein n=1 Tax=Saccharothrix mutabilis subsp. mutabilis TaxID=66855 RepID=A0ABP3ECB3_9PSEU
MVSRLLHEHAAADLLHSTLRPADDPARLSPADRVFGWTHPAGSGAHRAQLAVTRLTCPAAADAVTPIEPLTLPPLSTPKPAQGRFYLGRPDPDKGVTPLDPTLTGADWFTTGQIPRGRKVYPHQQWMENADPDTIRDRVRHRPPEGRSERDSQNSTLHDWIRPGATFTATVEFRDLSRIELGALLWLLDPDRTGHTGRPARFRLGHAKPLGFGSIHLRATAVTASTGTQIAHRLRTLGAQHPTTATGALAEEFEAAMSNNPPCRALLAAYRHAAAGFPADQDVHYPRAAPGDPGYDWFVANDKAKDRAQSLPPLGGPPLKERP